MTVRVSIFSSARSSRRWGPDNGAFVPNSFKRQVVESDELFIGLQRTVPGRIGQAIVNDDSSTWDQIRVNGFKNSSRGLVKVYI